MKKITALLAALGLCLCFAAYAADDAKPAAKADDAKAADTKPAAAAAQKELTTAEAKVNYMIGFTFQKQIPVKFDQEAFLAGIQDAQQEKDSRVPPDQMQAVQAEIMAKMKAEASVASEKNEKEGKEFLAANAKKDGVKTTKSGLQYTIVKDGSGPQPKATDSVKVNYTGTFIDGKKFDSSEDHGGPATFTVGGVVPGFSEALQLMKVGSKYKLFIPGDLAYGEKASPEIGPNRTLLFEMELLEIVAPDKSPMGMGGMEGMELPAPKEAKPAK